MPTWVKTSCIIISWVSPEQIRVKHRSSNCEILVHVSIQIITRYGCVLLWLAYLNLMESSIMNIISRGNSHVIVPNAAINGHLKLTFLKGRHRFDAISTSKLEVYIYFELGEFSSYLFLDAVNLNLIIFNAWWILNERMFYCLIILFT